MNHFVMLYYSICQLALLPCFPNADDFGWANTNYHRDIATPEVVTPHMDKLVKEGIMMMRHYVHPECTPSRVSFQTGRVPMHSGQAGLCSPTSAACGVPFNMTTIAQKLVNEGGMEAHQVGKWDVGAATPTHTPVGRGFKTSLNYFGHVRVNRKQNNSVSCISVRAIPFFAFVSHYHSKQQFIPLSH